MGAPDAARWLLLAWSLLLLSGCLPPANAAPVVKIGLIAPFEGLGRPLGYALLPGVKDAIARFNADPAYPYRVALIALDDGLDPVAAAERARALALDPTVMGVIGPWSAETAGAAAPVLAAAGVPAVLGAPAPDGGAASVCPPNGALAEALLARAGAMEGAVAIAGPDNALSAALLATGAVRLTGAPPDAVQVAVIHTGDAEAAAADLAAWRAAGWRGALFGGPDLAQPWFVLHAGESAAEGIMALVCGAGAPLSDGPTELAVPAGSALSATQTLLDAIAVVERAPGAPTRADIAGALAASPPGNGLTWLTVSSGEWQILPD
jgi:hypothetical protein